MRISDWSSDVCSSDLAASRPGARLGDIGAAIEAHANQYRYGVVREFCGHGLGRLFHDAPEVVHAAKAGTGPAFKAGMERKSVGEGQSVAVSVDSRGRRIIKKNK